MDNKKNTIGEFKSLCEKDLWVQCYLELLKSESIDEYDGRIFALVADMVIESVRERTSPTLEKIEKERYTMAVANNNNNKQ